MYRIYMISPNNVRMKLKDFEKEKDALKFIRKNNGHHMDQFGFVWDLDYSELCPKYSIADADQLVSLCIKEGWFTSGSNQQYEKMLRLNREGAPLDEIALAIWLCSSEVSRDYVKKKLLALKNSFLCGRQWDEKEEQEDGY